MISEEFPLAIANYCFSCLMLNNQIKLEHCKNTTGKQKKEREREREREETKRNLHTTYGFIQKKTNCSLDIITLLF